MKSQHQPEGRWIRVDKRIAIYLRDQFRCVLCFADLSKAPLRQISLDHYTPKALGGSNEASNVYTCCTECNNKRQLNNVPKHVLGRALAAMAKDITKYRKQARKMLGVCDNDYSRTMKLIQATW